MIPPSRFDPGNRKPLGFKCAIRSRQRLYRERQGPSFTLIRRDNYTTHSPFSVLRATKYRVKREPPRAIRPKRQK
jgi:hypothetical protein